MPFCLLRMMALFLALLGGSRPSDAAAPPATEARQATSKTTSSEQLNLLDLGTIRYLTPRRAREIWMGLDVGGVYVPKGVIADFDRNIWTARLTFPWAFAFTPWLSVGGRHELAWYDAENIRAQYSNQEFSLSLSPTAWSPIPGVIQDRLTIGFEAHGMFKSTLYGDNGTTNSFHPGGVFDRILYLGYGMAHQVRPRFSVDWNTQGRLVWVFINTQQQIRTSVRLRWQPRPAHTVALESVGFLIFREKIQAGNLLPRAGIVGQFALQYDWMSQRRVGFFTRLWGSTSFLSGTSPAFEIREEAINQPYGELAVGLRAAW